MGLCCSKEEKEFDNFDAIGDINDHVDPKAYKGVPHTRYLHKSALNTLPMSTLRVPTERDLKHIWAAFDKDKDGEWNTKELNDFTLQCRDRTMKMFIDEVKLDDPEISARRLDKAVQKERYYLLPVETRNNDDEEELKMMKEFIITALYVGHSTKKRITKKMFMTRYSNLADRLWTPRDHSGSIECTVS